MEREGKERYSGRGKGEGKKKGGDFLGVEKRRLSFPLLYMCIKKGNNV